MLSILAGYAIEYRGIVEHYRIRPTPSPLLELGMHLGSLIRAHDGVAEFQEAMRHGVPRRPVEQYLVVLQGGMCYPGDPIASRSLLSDVYRKRSPQWLTLSSSGRDPNLPLARLQFSRRHEVARTEPFRRQVERGARG